MFRVTDLIDLPLVSIAQDKKTGYIVKSVLLDGLKNRIAALICKGGVNKKYSCVLPYQNIVSIDINRIVVSNFDCVKRVLTKELYDYIMLENVLNTSIRSSDGDLHGILTDIYINLLNGKIAGYELSEGYLDDIVKGRKVININEALKNTISNNEIIISQRLN